MGYVNPYIYILFLLLLPFDTPRWLNLVLAFCLGISVDAFQNTMGLHTFSCVLMAYFRQPILHFLLPQLKNKKQSNLEFSLQEFGLQRALIYTGTLVFIHHFSLFILEAFQLELIRILIRTLLSSFISITLIIIIQYLLFKEAKR
ncbi:MAG: rod shape-determining protein MreD [Flavobacteriales bacterium]|nr:rod shape-determining protein MreD [Flavobacteriales bacterium]